jgi:hypothetical protein
VKLEGPKIWEKQSSCSGLLRSMPDKSMPRPDASVLPHLSFRLGKIPEADRVLPFAIICIPSGWIHVSTIMRATMLGFKFDPHHCRSHAFIDHQISFEPDLQMLHTIS